MRPKPASPRRADAQVGARAAVHQAIAAYTSALKSKDLKAVERAYPGLTARERDAWRQFFDMARDFQVTLNIERLAIKGSEAQLEVRGTYRYWNRSLNRNEESPVSFSAIVSRSTGAWRLSAIH